MSFKETIKKLLMYMTNVSYNCNGKTIIKFPYSFDGCIYYIDEHLIDIIDNIVQLHKNQNALIDELIAEGEAYDIGKAMANIKEWAF